MTFAETCAHKTCRCTRPYSAQTRAGGTRRIDSDGAFCSQRCERQAGQSEGHRGVGCECGHPQCTPQTTPDIPPMM